MSEEWRIVDDALERGRWVKLPNGQRQWRGPQRGGTYVLRVPADPCEACAVGYHGMCEEPTTCGCRTPDVDHDPDWDAIRRMFGDD